ncbi:relaxase/mobilization nuclease domain-containing protein [Ethanoligenens sp.]|uniref:relaxase/mobilization nuclease domain-containing protein n=1 Tax=Ethanoligenens sp. TaxID=2099655 RepID=UPI0039E81DB1
MAISKIRPLHGRNGESFVKTLKDREDYGMNPNKTDQGRLITAYQCNPHYAYKEFYATKQLYETLTGRSREHRVDVVAYLVIQSYKQGEITPEDANRLAYETVMEFTRGEHAFFVCTHVDRKNVHTHVYFNSTALDATRKFRNYYNSYKSLRAINDRLCKEHGYFVIEHPKEKGKSYKEWATEKAGTSWKAKLRQNIDTALPSAADFDNFLTRMRQAGYEIKRGKYISFRAPGQERFTRAKTLGADYTEQAIGARLAGRQRPTPVQKKARREYVSGINLLIDIQAKIDAGKSPGYERWAKIFNLKQAAKTFNYLSEHGIADYAGLLAHMTAVTEGMSEASSVMRKLGGRMAEVGTLKKHIANYSKTKKVFDQYKASGWSQSFRAQHAEELRLRQEAKQAFDALHTAKLPTMAQLQTEYTALLEQKKAKYEEYRCLKDEQYELQTVRRNVDQILRVELPDRQREQGR